MKDAQTLGIHSRRRNSLRGVPSERIRKARMFATLSRKLNRLADGFAIAREALHDLRGALGADAGLIMLRPPIDFLYMRHSACSEALHLLEVELREGTYPISDLLQPYEGCSVVYDAGLALIPLVWRGQIVGLLAFDLDGNKLAPFEESSLMFVVNHLSAVFGMRVSEVGPLVSTPKEMQNAAAVQQSFLPRVPEQSCGLAIATHTHSADFVGGDYFDLVLLDREKIGIVIADVEGKGVAAALFSNMLRSTVHFLTRETPSTAAVMGKVNAIFHREAGFARKLFSMFYAVFNTTQKTLMYSGSGHVRPIVIRAATNEVERLHSEGTLVGVAPGQQFCEKSLQLHEGDVIVFFTDGLTDRANTGGEPFGERRLIEILQERRKYSPEEILQEVLRTMSEFSTLQTEDDATILITKVL